MGHTVHVSFCGRLPWNCFAILTVAGLKFELTIKAKSHCMMSPLFCFAVDSCSFGH
jgi:hypothetical protein